MINAQEFIDLVAAEMSVGVDVAVESWMSQVEQAMCDPRLTTLGRMNSVKEVLNQSRCLEGRISTREPRVAPRSFNRQVKL